MIKSHKKLLIYDSIIILLSLVSIIGINILSGYKMILFLSICTFIFTIFFGTEKNIKEDIKNVLLELTIFLFAYWILYYLFGLLMGLEKTIYSIQIFLFTIIPIILYIGIREYLRYNILCKSETSDYITSLSIILFIMLDISFFKSIVPYLEAYSPIINFGILVLPVITSNLVYSYLSKKAGYYPVIYFGILIGIYKYLFPVIPNVTIFVTTIIDFFLPTILWVRMNSYYEKIENHQKIIDNSIINFSILSVSMIIITVMIYFGSGYFRFHAISIGTDTMEPEIRRGDIVLVDTKIKDADAIQLGEVVAFKYNNSTMVQRVVKKARENNQILFYVKSDSEEEKIITVKDTNIEGTIHLKINYLGYPTLWFNS